VPLRGLSFKKGKASVGAEGFERTSTRCSSSGGLHSRGGGENWEGKKQLPKPDRVVLLEVSEAKLAVYGSHYQARKLKSHCKEKHRCRLLLVIN